MEILSVGARALVDLCLKARGHGDQRGIGDLAGIAGREPGIAEANEHPRVVAQAVHAELQAQHEIPERLAGEEEQADVGPRLGDHDGLGRVQRHGAGARLLPLPEARAACRRTASEAGLERWRRQRGDEAVGQPPRQRHAGEHRVGRADRRQQARAGRVGVDDVMHAPVRGGHRGGGVGSHPQPAGLVVGGAQPVAVARQILGARGADDDRVDVVGHRVHRVPQVAVVARLRRLALLRWLARVAELDEGSWDTELVGFPGQGDTVGGVVGLQLADAAQRDDDVVVVDGAEVVDRVEVGDLLLQLGLGVGAQPVKASGRDLQMKVPDAAVRMGPAALDEQRGGLQVAVGRRQCRQRLTRDPEGVVGAHVAQQVGAEQSRAERVAKRQQRKADVFDRARREHDDAAVGDRDRRAAADANADDACHALLDDRLQAGDVAVGDDHQPLVRVVAAGFLLGVARGLHQQRHRAELVQREEPRARRARPAPRAAPPA